MNAEVLTVHQRLADPAGYAAHADLEAGMFRNEFRNTLAELALVLLSRSLSQRQQRRIVFHDGIHFRNMQRRTTVYPRHTVVDFDDQPLSVACRRARVVVIGSEGEIPIAVQRRNRNQKWAGVIWTFE